MNERIQITETAEVHVLPVKYRKPEAEPVAPPLRHDGGFKFAFDDLGIDLESGFGAGSFNGEADITYRSEDGQLEIFVGDITLRCHKWNGKQWDVRDVTLEYDGSRDGLHNQLYLAIFGEIMDGSLKDAVEDKARAEATP